MHRLDEADLLFRSGEFEKAANCAKDVLVRDPYDGDALVILARSLAAQGDILQAIENLQRAIEVSSAGQDYNLIDLERSPAARNHAGEVWFAKYAEALRVRDSDPELCERLLLEALWHSVSGPKSRPRDFLGMNRNVLFWLAKLRLSRGKTEEAYSLLLQCWMDLPDDPYVSGLLQELTALTRGGRR